MSRGKPRERRRVGSSQQGRYGRRVSISDVFAALAAVAAVAAVLVAMYARHDSKAAADIAEKALALARVEADRAVERSDVAWELEVRTYGVVHVKNVGSSEAHDVSVILTVNGVRVEVEGGDVEAGSWIRYESESHVNEITGGDPSSIGIHELMDSTHWRLVGRFEVTARVSWVSELGTPDVQVVP